MTFGNEDREYARRAILADWLNDFATQELKRNANYLDDIKDLYSLRNSISTVEDKVSELRERVGLDLVAKVEETEATKTAHLKSLAESKMNPKQMAQHIIQLTAFANALEAEGNQHMATEIDITIKAMMDNLTGSNINDAKDKTKSDVLKDAPQIKKFIDNLCHARQGHIELPAILTMIRDERPEDIDITDTELIKYIKNKLNEEKSVLPNSDDDLCGMESVTVFVVNDEDDGNTEVFDKPARL